MSILFGHSWENYIYSSPTRYGEPEPCVISALPRYWHFSFPPILPDSLFYFGGYGLISTTEIPGEPMGVLVELLLVGLRSVGIIISVALGVRARQPPLARALIDGDGWFHGGTAPGTCDHYCLLILMLCRFRPSSFRLKRTSFSSAFWLAWGRYPSRDMPARSASSRIWFSARRMAASVSVGCGDCWGSTNSKRAVKLVFRWW